MRVLIASLLVLALTGCASQVVTDYDSATVFGNYSSWAFASSNNGSDIVSLDDARVESAVERELNRKAMRKVAPSDADVLVTYRVEQVGRLDSTGFSYGLGLGHGHFGYGLAMSPPVRAVEEGKLVVELIDNTSSQVVWRAASKRYLNEDQNPQYRRELIDEVVAKMFEKYPPGV